MHRIDSGAVFVGTLQFSGRLEVAGQVRGDILADPLEGSLLVLESPGMVEGTIHVQRAEIAGRVVGPMRVEGLLSLANGARVAGETRYREAEFAHGCVVEGSLTHLDSPPPALRLDAIRRD